MGLAPGSPNPLEAGVSTHIAGQPSHLRPLPPFRLEGGRVEPRAVNQVTHMLSTLGPAVAYHLDEKLAAIPAGDHEGAFNSGASSFLTCHSFITEFLSIWVRGFLIRCRRGHRPAIDALRLPGSGRPSVHSGE